VIPQLNKLPTQISMLALLLSSEDHRNALLKVLKETRVPTSAIEFAFEGMVSTILATNGSALNVCPMSTVERLNVNTSLIRPTT